MYTTIYRVKEKSLRKKIYGTLYLLVTFSMVCSVIHLLLLTDINIYTPCAISGGSCGKVNKYQRGKIALNFYAIIAFKHNSEAWFLDLFTLLCRFNLLA